MLAHTPLGNAGVNCESSFSDELV